MYKMMQDAILYSYRGDTSQWTEVPLNLIHQTQALAGNEIVDHLDVIGASPVGAAPTTSSSST